MYVVDTSNIDINGTISISKRSNVFETNSSSTHSFYIPAKDSEILNSDNFKKDVININLDKTFGWGPEVLEDPITKAEYVLTYCGINNKVDHFDKIISLIKEKTGAEKININGLDIKSDNRIEIAGGIDHQSQRNLNIEQQTDDDLERLIFGNGFILVSNDNRGLDEDSQNKINDVFTVDTAVIIMNDNCEIIGLEEFVSMEEFYENGGKYYPYETGIRSRVSNVILSNFRNKYSESNYFPHMKDICKNNKEAIIKLVDWETDEEKFKKINYEVKKVE